MSHLSGKNGTVMLDDAEVTPIRHWQLKLTSENKEYATNETAGWKTRTGCLKDASGSFKMQIDDATNVPLEIGETGTIECHLDGSDANYYSGPIIVDDVDIEADIEGGAEEVYVVAFSATGAFTPYGLFDAAGAGGSGA